jgi:agmatinase
VPTEDSPRYGPPDALTSPRYSGVKTFARCPLVDDPDGVDVAVLGIPFDTATTNRPGARFGPEAVRAASIALRPYNPAQDAQVFGALSVADLGDVPVTPGNAERTVGQIASALEPIVRAGTRTLCLGGDHLVVLGELRAHAAVHGPLGLVLLDAHADVWDEYCGERYYHGSPFRRALEEEGSTPRARSWPGCAARCTAPADAAMPSDLGFEAIPCDELASLGPGVRRARASARRRGPLFLSFDVDVLDPAFAPGTEHPEAGGLSTREALGCVRALRGLRFSGYDVVESAALRRAGAGDRGRGRERRVRALTLDVLGQAA